MVAEFLGGLGAVKSSGLLDGLIGGGGDGEASTVIAPSQSIGSYTKTGGAIIEGLTINPASDVLGLTKQSYLYIAGAGILLVLALVYRKYRG